MDLNRIVIVHGYTSFPGDHWFPWVRDQFSPSGVEVVIPKLPNPMNPDARTWTDVTSAALGTPDEHTAVVTHSLGGLVGLRALDQLTGEWRLGALVEVAPFLNRESQLPELTTFTATIPDVAHLADHITTRAIIHSDNDPFVSDAEIDDLVRMLDAEDVLVPGQGHFLGDEAPEVAAILSR